MCGRYQLTTEDNIQEIQEIVSEINRRYMDKPILSQMKLGEIRPTDIVPMITNSKSFEPKPFLMQWGFSEFGEKANAYNQIRMSGFFVALYLLL